MLDEEPQLRDLGPDRKLEVTITDIDMAGEIEPNGFRGEDYRLLRVAKWVESVLRFDPGLPGIHHAEA